jgi:uncharacterized protein YjiS (DUF1127 family)
MTDEFLDLYKVGAILGAVASPLVAIVWTDMRRRTQNSENDIKELRDKIPSEHELRDIAISREHIEEIFKTQAAHGQVLARLETRLEMMMGGRK